MRDRIIALWQGQIPLPLVFWRITLLIGTVINVVATGLMLIAITAGIPAGAAFLLHLLPLPYNILALMAVWRSAMNYRGPMVWATAAQVAAVVWFALMLLI